MTSKKLSEKICNLIFNKKGYDVTLIDLKSVTTMADYFVICSADSDTQVQSIADEVEKKLRDEGIKCWHKEGYKALQWVLLDYVDVVVHIFKKETREFYSLEKLWGDATSKVIEDPALKKLKSAETKKAVKPKTVKKTKSE